MVKEVTNRETNSEQAKRGFMTKLPVKTGGKGAPRVTLMRR
jgi:hypothetical protein